MILKPEHIIDDNKDYKKSIENMPASYIEEVVWKRR